MEFRVLGPLEAIDRGRSLGLGPRKQRALLARLLLDAGRTVSVDRLLDDLWGDRLPDSAPKMVQIYISGLRKVLPSGTLETRPPGYVVHVAPEALDLERFERLALDGRMALEGGDPARAAGLLGEALALWRGPALAEFTEPFAVAERLRLDELHLTCVEHAIEAAIKLGRHDAVIADLERLVARHPHRERLRALQMVALYRAGRQGEALAAYQAFRVRLDEDLGIEPSRRLRDLEHAVLVQDPALSETAVAPSPTAAPTAEAPPAPVVTLPGRERELRCLHDALRAATAGTRRLVVVSGEPGIGRRALLDAFLAGIDGPDAPFVARAEAHPQRGALEPYAPILEALGRLADGPGGEVARRAVQERAPSWTTHLPWAPAVPGAERGVTRERLVRELLDALERIAAARPLVLVLEDLEHADASTCDLLDALVRRRAAAPLLVVLTFAATAPGGPLARALRELCLHGHAERLALGPLSEEAVAAVLAARFPGGPLPEGLARTLRDRADGHPLLGSLLLDHWLAEGLVADQDGTLVLRAPLDALGHGVPGGVRSLLADRLDDLSTADGELLQAAAVAGPAFEPAAVAAVVARPAADVAARLVELAGRHGDLEPDPGGGGRWRFRHPVMQEALLDLLPGERREALHRRLGEWLARREAPAASPHEIAHHLLAGDRPGAAARFLRRAADVAFARRAYDEGIALVRSALDAVRRLPDDPDRRRLEAELATRLGQALVATGGWSEPEAEAALRRARVLALRVGDNELLVSVSLALATLLEVRGEPDAAIAAAGEVLDGERPPGMEAHELLACTHFHQGAFARALEHAEVGAEAFDGDPASGHFDTFPSTLGDHAGVACHDWAALAIWFLGSPDRALERARVAVGLAKDPERAYGLAPALAQLAVLRQLRREPEETLRAAESAIAAARERGYAYRAAMGRVLRGWAQSMLGNADDGISEIVGGLAAARATGAHMEDPYFLALLADAHLEVGDVSSGLLAVEEGLRISGREHAAFCDPELHRLRAGLRRAGGAAPGAVAAELEAAVAIARRQHSRVLELRAAVDLASLYREEALRADGPQLVAEVLETFTEGFGTPDLREAAALVRGRPVHDGGSTV